MKLDKTTEAAYNRLRKVLGLSTATDLSVVLSLACTRINRLQDTLDGKYNPKKNKFCKKLFNVILSKNRNYKKTIKE